MKKFDNPARMLLNTDGPNKPIVKSKVNEEEVKKADPQLEQTVDKEKKVQESVISVKPAEDVVMVSQTIKYPRKLNNRMNRVIDELIVRDPQNIKQYTKKNLIVEAMEEYIKNKENELNL